jgi:serine kinase of HPr protein (carbohydrate metabolism regulator)
MPHSVVARSGSAGTGETLAARPAPVRLHASCVQLDGRGIVLLGASGAGKSDLALRLIDAGAILVADDQLLVENGAAGPVGRPADALAGLLEVRGVGILRLTYCRISPLGLVVELDSSKPVTRMPMPATYDLLGTELRLLHLDPRSPSAVAKLRIAMTAELAG